MQPDETQQRGIAARTTDQPSAAGTRLGLVPEPPGTLTTPQTRPEITAHADGHQHAAAPGGVPDSTGSAVPQQPADAAPALSVELLSGRKIPIHVAKHCARSTLWRRTPKGPRHFKEPLTYEHLYAHFTGSGQAIGLAPIPPGTSETRIAVLDLDSHRGETAWPDMLATAQGIVRAANAVGISPIPFRSYGGAGIHLIALWDTPQDAYSVRELMRKILEQCGLTDGAGKGVAGGQCEIFPKSNEVAADKFGSMFVLPLAGKSVPIDPERWELLTKDAAIPMPASRPVPVVAQPEPPPKSSAPVSTDQAELQSMLAVVDPNTLDYNGWRDIGYSLHSATNGSDEGLALFLDWSARNADKHDPEFAEREVWKRASDREGGITVRTLAAKAREHYNVADDFDDLGPDPAANDPVAGTVDADKLALYRVRTVAEILSQPRPTWFIKRVMPDGEVGAIFGESGAGKSFVWLDLGAAVDLGIDWRGYKTRKARVAAVIAEGAGDLPERLRAYEEHHGVKLGIGLIPAAPNLLDSGDITAVSATVKAFGANLLVIDTLAQTTPGAEENSSPDMSKALANCKRLHRETGAMVVLIAHAGKDVQRGIRGWSGIKAALDFELEVTRDGERRQLRVSKLKSGQDGAVFPFRLRTVAVGVDDEGEVVESCVVEPVEAKAKVRTPKTEYAKLAWQVVNDLSDLGEGAVSARDVLDVTVNKMVKPENKRGDDRRKGYARKALEALQSQGFVSIDDGVVTICAA